MKKYRCVIGEIISFPNKIIYLQSISNRKINHWVGHCKGDNSHKEHLIIIKRSGKWQLLHPKTDIFKKPDGKTFAKRLFERESYLRCPEGKCYMNIQRKATSDIGNDTVDIYRCNGNSKGAGHKEHYVRIQHGTLDVELNKKEIGVLIVTLESD